MIQKYVDWNGSKEGTEFSQGWGECVIDFDALQMRYKYWLSPFTG